MAEPETVRVVLADDHPMYRYGVAAVLADVPGIELVGQAASGTQLLELVRACTPDVVITDLRMPDLTGIEVTRALLRTWPELPVLVLTMHDDDESVYGAMRAGARGYLLKGADSGELVSTVRTLASGGTSFGPAVARRIVGFFLESSARYTQGTFPELTPRERQVLDLLAAGRRNSAIAAQLELSEKTVRNHLSAILTKLQVADRAAAIVRAREAGLGR
ncbi:MAG TPA: response regulator transcription factor [Marmoricola sp.]|jgi:DNA-binding NarL/FixJ family response regulator|nr:response regulator transcription factor [Marmoricola sp.]